MFGYARDHEPCVIFMDEIDAIGGRRFSEGTSADREIQRTLMEVSLKIILYRQILRGDGIASQPNGRFRLFRPNKTDHGH
jgi:hypothetical protein